MVKRSVSSKEIGILPPDVTPEQRRAIIRYGEEVAQELHGTLVIENIVPSEKDFNPLEAYQYPTRLRVLTII